MHRNKLHYKSTDELTDDERMDELEVQLLRGNYLGAEQQLEGILEKKKILMLNMGSP